MRMEIKAEHAILVLAVQNMEASHSIPMTQDIEFNALEGSLNMMSKGEILHIVFYGTNGLPYISQSSMMSLTCECLVTSYCCRHRVTMACSNRMDSGRFESVLKVRD